MHLFEAVRLALAQIRVQKLKSFFTLIGVAIGVMFLIAVVSIVEGMGRYMEEDLVGKIIAKGSFELRHRPNIQLGDVDEAEWRSWLSRPRITEDDVEPVAAVLAPTTRWAMLGYDQLSAESRYARPRRVEVNCVSEQWFAIKNMGVQTGRLPTAQEYELGTPVVVIGEDVKTHFFGDLDPIGRQLRIAGIPYEVVGVAEKQGSKLYGELRLGHHGSEAIGHSKTLESHALPGQVIIGSDSHTPHAGAVGCVAFGVGTTAIFNSWITRDVRVTVPETVKIVVSGKKPANVTAKDFMLEILRHPSVKSGKAVGK